MVNSNAKQLGRDNLVSRHATIVYGNHNRYNAPAAMNIYYDLKEED